MCLHYKPDNKIGYIMELFHYWHVASDSNVLSTKPMQNV